MFPERYLTLIAHHALTERLHKKQLSQESIIYLTRDHEKDEYDGRSS